MFDLTLTFDNGPAMDATPGVLDVLKRRSIRATFFLIGERLAAAGARAIAQRAKDEGHRIGNHTWSHSGPFGQRKEGDLAEREIGRTQQALGDLADEHRLFRPQGGGGRLGQHLLNAGTADFLIRGKFTCVLWNAIPRDWSDPDGWVERALGQCRTQKWTLMVLHDLPTGAMRHLDRFLDKVGETGGRLRQDFPPDCVPIADGIVVRPMDEYVAGGSD